MIAIVDYKMGNTRSVAKTLKAMGHDTILTNNPDQLRDASHIILPGVGAYEDGMKNLQELQLLEILGDEVLRKGKPFLAICIGLQLLAETGMEHGGPHKGLGWIQGRVDRFSVDEQIYKVPHVGWNNISLKGESPLFHGISTSQPDFYFVHSYHLQDANPADVIATCEYGETFVAAIQRNNIFGTQFHPEKSQGLGVQLLQNFIAL